MLQAVTSYNQESVWLAHKAGILTADCLESVVALTSQPCEPAWPVTGMVFIGN
jgi:hypothetical protein